jgi:HK97 family phage major capsid protein
MNPKLRALLERKQKAAAAARKLHDTAAQENRDLTEDEVKEFDAHMADVEKINADVERETRLIEAERTAQALPAGDGARVSERGEDDPRRGFHSFGEFAVSVMRAGMPGGRGEMDERLYIGAAPTTYGNEGTGADGGFLVPPEYSREVFQHSLEEDALLPLTDNFPVMGNSLVFPRDETTPWGTDGIRAYWENEAGQATQTKPKGDTATLRLSKLMALVPVTDELAEDTNALAAYIGRKTSESIRWKTDLALFEGSGIGQPKGFFGHASQVSVAKETSQVADTVVAANVAKMFARCLGRRNAIWMINDDVLPQLITMTISNQPIWTPPNAGMQQAPAGLLLGRPIVPKQVCKTVGDQGDIVLANWRYYRSITKAGAAIQTATSMHLFFDFGLGAFRATFRIDGQPAITAAVSPANGSNSLSPFVVLDARA